MATRTIANGGGNWSANATWVEGTAPTAADSVVATATSGAVTIDGTSVSPNLCRGADFTGYVSTLTHATTKQLNVGDGTAGAFKLVAGMTYVPSVTSLLKFISTATGNNLTFAGKSMGAMTFDGVGGAWQHQDTLNTVTDAIYTLTNGAVDWNSQNIKSATAGQGVKFSSNNSNTRSVTTGTMTFNLSINTGTVWDITNSSGMTFTGTGCTITASGTTSIAAFAGGGLSYGPTTLKANAGSWTISGANTFTSLDISKNSGGTLTTASGVFLSASQTVSGAFTTSGVSTIARAFIASSTVGTSATISVGGAITATHTDFRDIAGVTTGAGSWNFSALTTTANGDAGGNSGITFTAPKNCYMKTAVSVNWSGSNWFTASGGSTPIVPAIPLVHDLAFFDINSVTAGSKIITLDEPRIPSTDWTDIANTPAFATSSSYEIYGSLILVSGMTHTGGAGATFMGRGAYSLDGGSLTWPTSSTITISAPSGTLSLARNLTSNSGLNITAGTFNGAFTSSFTAGTVSGGIYTPQGTASFSANFSVSSGILNLAQQINNSGPLTVSGGVINDTGASGELKGSTASFTGGTSTIRKMTLTSTFAISSTANLTLNPGTYTYVTSWTETGTTKTFTINGTLSETGGVKTVTAAGGSFTFG